MSLVRHTIIALLLGFAAQSAVSQSAGSFARMGFGARGMSMGNALAGDVSGYGDPYYNPALAPFIPEQRLDVSAALMTFDRELQFLQLATPLRPRAGIAAGIIHAGVNNIDGRDGSGYHSGMLSTDEFAFFLAFGVEVSQRATVGIGLQLFRSDLHESLKPARSLGIDVGVSMRLTQALNVGIVADDLLARYSWDASDATGGSGGSSSDPFPRRIRVGASYELQSSRLLVTAEYEFRFRSADITLRSVGLVGDTPREIVTRETLRLYEGRIRLGAEYRPIDILAIRGGMGQAAGGLKPSAGFMFEQAVGALLIHAEYAFVVEPHFLGSMHLVTVRFFL